MNREPIFGENAKPFFIQAAVAIVVYNTLKWATDGWLYAWIRSGVEAILQ